MWLSDLVSDEPVTDAQLADVVAHGPAVVGAVFVAAVALGVRSGSDGGPISLESADARHLMLAPIPRRAVLLRPVGQRMRAVAFAGAVTGAIAGQLAARRLPGSAAAWAASGAVAAALSGLAFVAVAVVVHASRVPRWLATAAALALLVWQGAAIAWGWPGPGNAIGSLAMWGMRTRPVDLVAVAAVVVLAVVALVAADRLRVEPLVRRADLVSQLHFAVTVQDLRTVVLLRRQLRGERPRSTPWVRIGRSTAPTAPASRRRRHRCRGAPRPARPEPLPRCPAGRMAVLAVLAGLAVVAVLRGTTPALLVVGFALYLVGLDAVEPLSQEIDHPDVADGVPRQRGWVLVRHLVAPALAVAPFALVGAATVAPRRARGGRCGVRAGAAHGTRRGVRRRRQRRARCRRSAAVGERGRTAGVRRVLLDDPLRHPARSSARSRPSPPSCSASSPRRATSGASPSSMRC